MKTVVTADFPRFNINLQAGNITSLADSRGFPERKRTTGATKEKEGRRAKKSHRWTFFFLLRKKSWYSVSWEE